MAFLKSFSFWRHSPICQQKTNLGHSNHTAAVVLDRRTHHSLGLVPGHAVDIGVEPAPEMKLLKAVTLLTVFTLLHFVCLESSLSTKSGRKV